jgi:hypothetical protein
MIIDKLAVVIADRKYGDQERDIAETPMSQNERARSIALLKQDKSVSVSCQGLKGVVNLTLAVNKSIIKKLEQSEAEGNTRNARKMILANALLAHELLDFAIAYFEDFKVPGVDELRRLYERSMTEQDHLLKEEAQREKDAGANDIKPAIREQILSDVKTRREALRMLGEEWGKYMKSIENTQSKAMDIKGSLPSLRILRDNAKGQIKVVEALSVLGWLKNNVGAIESTVEALTGIELIPLSADRVKKLLGVDT